MTRFVVVVLFVCCVCGCTEAPKTIFLICYDYDGASPMEIDEVASSKIVPHLGPDVVRTVAEEGKLYVCLSPTRTAKEIENDLNKINGLPELMSFVSIHVLHVELPAKSQLADATEIQIKINEKGRQLGVTSEEIAKAIYYMENKDVEVIKNETFITTPDGKEVRFGDVATLIDKTRRSRIVRDYEDGREK